MRRTFRRILSAALLLGAVAAPAPAGLEVDPEIEARIDALMARMTLAEKIGQLNQHSSSFDLTGPPPAAGRGKARYEMLTSGGVGSMLNVIAKARELGYMRAPDDLFVPIKQIRDLPDRETLLLMTGSQGEPLAALSRISRGEHPQVQVKPSDTIIFSASPIPRPSCRRYRMTPSPSSAISSIARWSCGPQSPLCLPAAPATACWMP